MVYDLEFMSVYHYRNRWTLGKIKGRLDLKTRKFSPEGRKAGMVSINADNKNSLVALKENNWMSLKEWLVRYILIDVPLEKVMNEAVYVERLILKAVSCKKIWVTEYHQQIRMISEKYKHLYPKASESINTCTVCGLQWSVYPNIGGIVICSGCREFTKDSPFPRKENIEK